MRLRLELLLLIGFLFVLFGFYVLPFHSSQNCAQIDRQDPLVPLLPLSQEQQKLRWLTDHVSSICPRVNSRVAIVMPFHGDDPTTVIENINRWKQDLFAPCEVGSESYIDFIFSNCLGTESIQTQIEAAITPEIRSCFKSISFVFEDHLKSRSHDLGSLQHFNATLHRLEGLYDYFFLMEPDTFPIRSGWLHKVFTEAVCGADFWMKGSHSRDTTEHSVLHYGWHINGNALYNLANEVTLNMLYGILEQADPPIYDIAIEKWIVRNPKTVEIVRRYRHLYTISDFVYNTGPRDWSVHQWRKEFPNTYFVHGNMIHEEPEATFMSY